MATGLEIINQTKQQLGDEKGVNYEATKQAILRRRGKVSKTNEALDHCKNRSIQEPRKRKHETQAVATQRPNLSLTKLKRRHLKAIRAGWDFNTIEDFNSFEGIDNEMPIKVHPTDHEKDTFHVCNFDLNDQALMPTV